MRSEVSLLSLGSHGNKFCAALGRRFCFLSPKFDFPPAIWDNTSVVRQGFAAPDGMVIWHQPTSRSEEILPLISLWTACCGDAPGWVHCRFMHPQKPVVGLPLSAGKAMRSFSCMGTNLATH